MVGQGVQGKGGGADDDVLHGARYVYSGKHPAKEHGFVVTVTVNPHRTPDDNALAKEVGALAEMLKTLTGQAFVPVYKEAATVG